MKETDHDILIEVRQDVKHLITEHEELKLEFHKECLPRINKLELQQMRWLGRDGAIVAGITLFLTYIVNGILNIGK